MKRIIVLIIIMWIVLNVLGYTQAQKEETRTDVFTQSDIITKTYILRHIAPSTAHQTLKEYFLRSSYEPNGNIITVKILKENIAKFEGLLRQIDVEKKKILVRIFTVIASRDNKGSDIQNKELKQVLYELQKLLNFNTYRMDGVSAVTVMEGQHHCDLTLSSRTPLKLQLGSIRLEGGTPGTRSINFEFRLNQLQEKDGQVVSSDTLVSSQTSIKENGYLVAGVSQIGKNGDSLVLIINAEIK